MYVFNKITVKPQLPKTINRLDETNSQKMEGLCYQCAKDMGINPLEALAKQAQDENTAKAETSDTESKGE